MTTRPAAELTLFDRLSHLTPAQAARMLGSRARTLLREGGAFEIQIEEQVALDARALRLDLGEAVVTATLAPASSAGLRVDCSVCREACVHRAALLALVLEEKTALGLAEPPPERRPARARSPHELEADALAEREERARKERMTVRSADARTPWGDYVVSNPTSGRSHRVALRGIGRGVSYCSCPDFRKNTLGTCKHVMRVERHVQRRFPARRLTRPPERQDFSLYVHYGAERSLRLAFPSRALDTGVRRIVARLEGRDLDDVTDLLARIGKLEALGERVRVHPDADELLRERRLREHLQRIAVGIRGRTASHPLRRTLLREELLPYQLDGIAFAVGAGRAILADEMGLGKTIQGIGVAELLAREAGIERVLVVCPASVKGQWRREIRRFSQRSVSVVLGGARERAAQYRGDAFFHVCNYEQVLRDASAIAAARFDLVILDEAQRIKNWEARTSRAVKALRSPFALALSGTPLENRLDELYSVLEFVDERRLGPAFRFFEEHHVTSEKGGTLGYRELARLRARLTPVLLRRTRRQVQEDLPPRSTEVVRIEPTERQAELHRAHMQIVAGIVRKRFLTELDLLRLRQALLMCRLAADASVLVDGEEPNHSSKLKRLQELLTQLLAEPERKIVLFSEWTRMLDRIEPILEAAGARFVRLDGRVAQRRRQALVDAFQRDSAVRVFLTTNAGSTGLNLQAADTVVNVDLPWNPAVLEQRIGRAHRMGQRRPVQVYLLVTEATLEENLLATLAAKHELAAAVLDPDSDVDAVDRFGGMEDLRQRLERLLGAKPDVAGEPTAATGDASADGDASGGGNRMTADGERRERVARAGGALVTAAVGLLAEMLPAGDASDRQLDLAREIRAQLGGCLDPDPDGGYRLSVKLPDASLLDALAGVVARSLAGAGPR